MLINLKMNVFEKYQKNYQAGTHFELTSKQKSTKPYKENRIMKSIMKYLKKLRFQAGMSGMDLR